MGYSAGMDFTDFMLWKLLAIGAIAFFYSFWKAATSPRDPPTKD